MSTATTLSTLPVELLFQISTFLSAESAIALAKTCRACYNVVYDTTVFRHILEGSNSSWESDWVSTSVNLKDIVKRRGDDAAVLARYKVFASSRRNLWGSDDELSSTLQKLLGRSGDGWIRYSVANEKAFTTCTKLDDLLENPRKAREAHLSRSIDQLLTYLPQLVVLKHPCLHSPSTVPLLMAQIEAASQSDIDAAIDSRLAYAYCGSILSHSNPLEAVTGDWSASRRKLERFAYQRIATMQRKLKTSEYARISQADGQILLGTLSALLRLAFRNYRVQNLMGIEYYTFIVPFLFDLPVFREKSWNALPLPFETDDPAGRTFDGFQQAHVKSMMEELNNAEWVGCFSYSKQSLEFESPMRNVRWNVTPTKHGLYRVIARGSDSLGDFALTGVGHEDGNLRLRKTYMGGRAWDYSCILTPFGITGLWGSVGLNDIRGALWLWRSDWTAPA